MIQPKKIFRTKEGKLGFEWNDASMNIPVKKFWTIRLFPWM